MNLKYDAVIFDLLTGLIDSWTLWNTVAGDSETGKRWRHRYLELTYGTGDYQPYEELVVQAAVECGLGEAPGKTLAARWGELEPWPEARQVLEELKQHVPLAVVTNCSFRLGEIAASRMDIDFDVVVIAEQAGAYKPDPRPYRLALEKLDVTPERALFVAGSPFDIIGAGRIGMPVYWHNKAGLARPNQEIEALVTEETSLEPLVRLVTGKS